MTQARCPALLIAAPASGQGKTTVTAALARLHARQGRRVRVFKCGPDFLDPMILARASGAPVYQLDLWMVGEAEARRLLARAAGEADLILIEGVMGLFDGNPSAADLARRFGVPVLGVINGAAMAQTFGALAYGLAHFQPDLPFSGARQPRRQPAPQRHPARLPAARHALVRRSAALGRIRIAEPPPGPGQAEELADLDVRLDAAADALLASAETDLPEPVTFEVPAPAPLQRSLEGVRIGVARDASFAFLYQANLDLLRELGAELAFFSPLQDQALPAVDSLYLPGGYPELYLGRLQGNRAMAEAIRAHHAAGKPLLAECGGMLYLLDCLEDADGERGELLGLLPGRARLQKRLTALALQEVELPEGRLRGHTFHHSTLDCAVEPLARGVCPNGRNTAEAVFRLGRLTASYIHFYLPSNPQAAAALLAPARDAD